MTELALHVDPRAATHGDGSRARPLARVEDALARLRVTRRPGQRGVVWLHEGTHHIAHPLVLGHVDSHLTLKAWPGARPVIDGGTEISAWQPATLRGRDVWCAAAPEGCGRALFVDGHRVPRPRWPRQGDRRLVPEPDVDLGADPFHDLFAGSSTARVDPADLDGVDLAEGLDLVIGHFWVHERLPLTGLDHATGVLESSRRSLFALRDGVESEPARWWLEGVATLLGEVPGEWILDTQGALALEGEALPGGPRVVYAPRAQDRIDNFRAVVPHTANLLAITGTAARPVTDVTVEGISFRHAEWPSPLAARPPFGIREDPDLPDVDYASDTQAACTVPGAIAVTYAQEISVVACSVEHVGGFGIRLGDGVRGCRVSRTAVRDTGAGAFACGGGADTDGEDATSHVEISDCTLTDGGRTYPHAAAVLIQHARRVSIVHNLISHHPSTGIAVGWRWDYGASAAVDNLIEGNRLTALGGSEVDWFGAIYTLGVSPGTRIRRNLIYDVHAPRFGGWGLLIDPSSSHLVIEENVIRDVSAECVHIKTGRENILRRNILAAGGTGLVSLAVAEGHVAATLTHHVMMPGPMPVFVGAPGSLDARTLIASDSLRSDAHLVWSGGSAPVLAGDIDRDEHGWRVRTDVTEKWRAAGHDATTAVIDPGVVEGADGTLTVVSAQVAARGLWDGTGLHVGPRTHRDPNKPSAKSRSAR